MDKVFTYGTLCIPEVMRAVTGRCFASQPACLPDYKRRLLRGRVYPGITPCPGDSVSGILHHGITPALLRRLDHFEGDEYDRDRVSVETADGDIREAWAYIIPPRRAMLLSDRDWDGTRFRHQHLKAYRQHCRNSMTSFQPRRRR